MQSPESDACICTFSNATYTIPVMRTNKLTQKGPAELGELSSPGAGTRRRRQAFSETGAIDWEACYALRTGSTASVTLVQWRSSKRNEQS